MYVPDYRSPQTQYERKYASIIGSPAKEREKNVYIVYLDGLETGYSVTIA